MPTSTWTCRLSWNGVSYADPSPGNPDTLHSRFFLGFTCIAKPATDPMPQFNTPVDYGSFELSIGYIAGIGTSIGVGYRFGDSEVNTNFWSSHPSTPTFSGLLLTDFTAGGNIDITKDFDNDLLTMNIGPITYTVPLSGYDPSTGAGPSYLNTHPLVPQGYTAGFTIADPTGTFPAYNATYSGKFFDMIAEENGVPYQSLALSSGDPGHWWPDYAVAFDPLVGGTAFPGGAPYWTRTQEATRQKIEGHVLAASYPGYRIFDYWRHLQSMGSGEVDMIHASEHGAHFVAEVLNDPTMLTWMRTHDKGGSWVNGLIYHDVAAANMSPSINWAFGRLYVCWYNGTDILQAFSLDLANSWSTPVTLSITGTDPRHLVDPATGFSWYFYIDGADLKVKRSGDYGATFIGSPVTVVATITAQKVAAQLALDGSLLVGYVDTGTWTQVRSTDLGLTWS